MRTVVGFGMIVSGGVLIFGGVTGRLAPMLAALFAPSALTARNGGGGSPAGSSGGRAGWFENLVPFTGLPSEVYG